ETEGLTGEDAVYSLLSWEDGSFKLIMGAEPRSRTIDKSWSGLLLEGMRRIDESTAAWSPEWEGEESQDQIAADNHLQERIVKALSNLRDVDTAVIFSSDGTVIAQDKSKDPDGEVIMGRYIQEKAELIGGYLNGGEMERMVLTGSEKRVYLQLDEDNLTLLTLPIKSSAETVSESVQTVRKRYRSA
ncbi:MAG: DUF4388 domain-containing protein, partial [Anaerolineales bacterium]|nr:DUF4388 domain-containing protein [Anaerolineales bacterium]